MRQIAELAVQRHTPSIYGVSEYAEDGGLMVYGTNFLDLERRAATFVDKILKGAKPVGHVHRNISIDSPLRPL